MKIHNLGRDTSGRPLLVDDRTLRKLRLAEERLGWRFTIVQGSFRAGRARRAFRAVARAVRAVVSRTPASAGTHDRAGVIDLRTWDLPAYISPWKATLELRRAGLIAWYRTKAQGFDVHVHAIDYGSRNLAPVAARQVAAYEAGRNGLKNNGPDDGPQVAIPKDPPGKEAPVGRMPAAQWLGEHSPRRPMARYDIVCVHTIVGFAPAHAAHFSVKRDGTILQSRDTAFQSGANLDGNPRIIAIENEDEGRWWEPLTDAQVASNAAILRWAHETHGVPLQLCPNSRPRSRGLAYHRQGIDGNFGGMRFPGRVRFGEKWTKHFGKVCPGDAKIAQLPDILALARGDQKDEDMPYLDWPEKDKKALVRDVSHATVKASRRWSLFGKKRKPLSDADVMRQLAGQIRRLDAHMAKVEKFMAEQRGEVDPGPKAPGPTS